MNLSRTAIVVMFLVVVVAMFVAVGGGTEAKDDGAAAATALPMPLAPPTPEMVQALHNCSMAESDRRHLTLNDKWAAMTAKGYANEMQADAEAHAGAEMAFLNRVSGQPKSQADRISHYSAALALTAESGATPEQKLRADAISAYYFALETGDVCPINDNILQFIGKKKT